MKFGTIASGSSGNCLYVGNEETHIPVSYTHLAVYKSPGYKWMCRRCKTVVLFKYLRRVIEVAGPVVLLLLATMALVGNSYNPFLYFQF